MPKLRYGINKVPDSGTIEMNRDPSHPSRNIYKIRLPERPPIANTPNSMEHQEPMSSDSQNMQYLSSMLRANALSRMASPQPSIDSEYKRLDNLRNQIMEKRQMLDQMGEYAAKRNPGILEDFKTGRRDHYDEYLKMFPDHEKIDEELGTLEDQYANDPLHDEHFGKILERLRK